MSPVKMFSVLAISFILSTPSWANPPINDQTGEQKKSWHQDRWQEKRAEWREERREERRDERREERKAEWKSHHEGEQEANKQPASPSTSEDPGERTGFQHGQTTTGSVPPASFAPG